MRKLFGVFVLCVLLLGCNEKKVEPVVETPRISPGPPRYFDIGDQTLKHPLPEDVEDGFLQLGNAPNFSYGLNMAHKSFSRRSHDRSDLMIYIHSGYGWFHVGAEDYWVSVGDAVYIPRGAIYSLENKSVSPIQFFSVYSPPLDPDDVVYHNTEATTDQDSLESVG